MLEIIELCRKYGISISFDLFSVDQFDVLKFINIRIFDHSSGRCSAHVFSYEELDNVADKDVHITNAMKHLLDSILLEKIIRD